MDSVPAEAGTPTVVLAVHAQHGDHVAGRSVAAIVAALTGRITPRSVTAP